MRNDLNLEWSEVGDKGRGARIAARANKAWGCALMVISPLGLLAGAIFFSGHRYGWDPWDLLLPACGGLFLIGLVMYIVGRVRMWIHSREA